ncbi:hypothetical protein PIROE2DRAFT_68560 [Piromyces sp. E2]|nr:hypothetical protein PIROE2DRAFT_68560 [Piromyces sp. E2]|eukprot:OUM69426.1 hypothetical protein PIROE2DRAFT_68560 [Piromyces sp. E2]
MNQNNQPSCPPRLVSYDKALDHKITNQYMNTIHPIKQTSVHSQSMSIQQSPSKTSSVYSNYSPNQIPSYNPSINRPNYVPSQRIPPQNLQPPTVRLNSTPAGDLSMQSMNYVQPKTQNLNSNILNPTLNNDPNDFNSNFYIKAEKSKKYGFFDVVSNVKQMSQQNKISKWALIFVIVQVIFIVTLETLLLMNYYHYYHQLSQQEKDYKSHFGQMKSLLIYQLIFIFSQFYVLIMYYDSFRLSSSIQLITVSIFNIIIADLSDLEMYKKVRDEDEYHNTLILLFLSILLFKRFGWNIYRNVGADIKKTVVLKRRYNLGLVMKFKFFFIFGIITQCFNFSDEVNDSKIDFSKDFLNSFEIIVRSYATHVLSVILIINILCGYLSVKKENKLLMALHIITDMIFIIFSVYMIYTINTKRDTKLSNYKGESKYTAVKNSLSVFAIIEILLLFISIYFSMVVMADFNTVDLTEDNETNEIGRRLSL